MPMLRRIIITILTIVLPGMGALGQFPDSKGTDFWLTFIPNYHNNASILPENPALQLEHQIYIYISSERPTRGSITLRNEQGVETVVPFSISDPTQMFEFRTFFMPYELRGWNNHGAIDFTNMQTEKVAQQSVHIVSDDEVSVYSLNQGDLTSDAFMCLPTDALGDDYTVMAYTSDITTTDPFNQEITPSSTPSQFAVVATQDNTTITITPTAQTFLSAPGEQQIVVLNRGQSYLVQPDPRFDDRSDLTGSLVRSNKPIAVFAGHQRCVLPIEDKGTLGSRDCLVEQMNPIVTWGKSAFITPLAISTNEFNVGDNLFRVVAAFDSTEVFVDDQFVARLQPGEFYEAPIRQAHIVETTRPTMVAMFKKTAGPGQLGQARYGDPFVTLVPPFEQFMNTYRFVSIQAYDWTIINNVPVPLSTIYDEQWLNVVIPERYVSSLRLDGAVVAESFNPIGTSGFSWAQIPMNDGVHEITADTIFGIYVYGYGLANSYGYIGGMAFRPLDVYSPRVGGTTVCTSFEGRVTDSLLGDTKLREVSIVPGSEQNVTAALGPFEPPQAVVTFLATLINPYLDGRLSIEAMDNVRQTTRSSVNIPGFTVGPVGHGSNPAPERMRTILPIGRRGCDTVMIENYGNYAHTVEQLYTSQGGEIAEPPLPFTIGPGQIIPVVICRSFMTAGIQFDTLMIGDTCLVRPATEIEYDVRNDQEAPDISGTADACSTTVDILIRDDRDFDFGLASVTVREDLLVNCTVDTVSTGVRITRFRVNILDPLLDAIYGFEAVDSAGNKNVKIDTIGGFTLSIGGDADLFTTRTMQSSDVGSLLCDSVKITNYGLTTQIIREVFVRGNVRFSTPHNQFPLIIEPGESADLVICYEPVVADTAPDVDTIELRHACLVKAIEVKAVATPIEFNGISRCDIPVNVTVDKVKNEALYMPNPATDQVTVVLPREASALAVKIMDINGREVLTMQWSGAPSRSFLFDVSSVADGTYAVMLTYDGHVSHDLLVIQ